LIRRNNESEDSEDEPRYRLLWMGNKLERVILQMLEFYPCMLAEYTACGI